MSLFSFRTGATRTLHKNLDPGKNTKIVIFSFLYVRLIWFVEQLIIDGAPLGLELHRAQEYTRLKTTLALYYTRLKTTR